MNSYLVLDKVKPNLLPRPRLLLLLMNKGGKQIVVYIYIYHLTPVIYVGVGNILFNKSTNDQISFNKWVLTPLGHTYTRLQSRPMNNFGYVIYNAS